MIYLIPYTPSRVLLVIPRIAKSTIGGRAFSYRAPLLWNTFPAHVRGTDTDSLFKARLKTYIFSLSYSWGAGVGGWHKLFINSFSAGLWSGQCCHWIIIGSAVLNLTSHVLFDNQGTSPNAVPSLKKILLLLVVFQLFPVLLLKYFCAPCMLKFKNSLDFFLLAIFCWCTAR